MFSDHPDAYVEFLGSRYRRKEGIRRLYSESYKTEEGNELTIASRPFRTNLRQWEERPCPRLSA